MDTCAYDRAVERDGRDPYDVLGVDPSASDDEVRAAFLLKAEIYHPDRYQDRPSGVRQEATKMMAELTEARDKISRRRAARAGAMPSTPGGPPPSQSRPPSRTRKAPQEKAPPAAPGPTRGQWAATVAAVAVVVVVGLVAAVANHDDSPPSESAQAPRSVNRPPTSATSAPTTTTVIPTTTTTAPPPTTEAFDDMTVERLVAMPPPTCAYLEGASTGGFQVIQGSAEDPGSDGELQAVVGDLTGDGLADGAYTTACNGGGSDVLYNTYVFDASGSPLGELPVGQDAGQTLTSFRFGLEIVDGLVKMQAYGPVDCHACDPLYVAGLTYRWNGWGFDRLAEPAGPDY